ncbi:MAG: MBL fold metallo-hydrolase [Myxococcales bacterium]|nr:MBL fold metallo-hydrolase [Myxococcales bacterium]
MSPPPRPFPRARPFPGAHGRQRLREVMPGLWATRDESIGSGVNTVGYLLQRREGGNVFIYSTSQLEDEDAALELRALGGINRILLNHRDEASPYVESLSRRFAASVMTHERERRACELKGVTPTRAFSEPETALGRDLVAYHTPGHTPGVMSYLWRNPHDGGRGYLFTGDTLTRASFERVESLLSFYPFRGNRLELQRSLELLRALDSAYVLPGLARGEPVAAFEWSADERRAALDPMIDALAASASGSYPSGLLRIDP